MPQVGTVQAVCRYPVKSMAGEEVAQAFVGFSGIMGDRVYAFVREEGAKGFPWHTSREQEDMVLFRPKFLDPAAATFPVDMQASLDMAPGVNPIFPGRETFSVEVATPDGRTVPVDSDELASDLERRSGGKVRLRFSERSLYDCRPVSLFGNASAAALGEELGMRVDRRRFRANFYVDWIDDRPYLENDFVGRRLRIGDRASILVVDRDPRCKVITIDPDTSETSPRVLRHVAAAHAGTAGVYAAVVSEGVVNRGDPVVLIDD